MSALRAAITPGSADNFPREQVYVVRYRQLIDEPERTLESISAFLGVDQSRARDIPSSNVSGWAGAGAVDNALRYLMRGGAALGSFVRPTVWRRAQRPLLSALHRGGRQRPSLALDVRRGLVGRFAEDIDLLESLLGRSFQDWLGDSGLGTYAVRSSLAPSGREPSQ